ncbi:MAG TPA: chorismate synthase [Phycisphaerae bacterium]|nr:chorismate synthase [Phycisphaerae bacterium]HRW55274.1 chorismate synthase [Phycisphaerae bacterium]
MAQLDYRTAGESHGQALIVLIEGAPAGLSLDTAFINESLRRRQGGFGRGGRQKIETDVVNILSGVRAGVSIGAPIAMQLANKDWRIDTAPPVHRPRPGHADFAGAMKYETDDCRSILERASARETASRTAAGAIARLLLREFGVEVVGFVSSIGDVQATIPDSVTPDALTSARDDSDVYCPDAAASAQMIDAIKAAKKDKDTLGGVVEVRAFGMPPGVGSCMRWQDRLETRLMGAVGSIQAFKGVEIGLGFGCARVPGSHVHDEMDFDPGRAHESGLGFSRRSNRAGGIEGGMTNGMPVIVRGAMKPISTLLRGLDSVNLQTLSPERSDYERSDICAVPAASVVAEQVVAFELARSLLEKFGGDTIDAVRASLDRYMASHRERLLNR